MSRNISAALQQIPSFNLISHHRIKKKIILANNSLFYPSELQVHISQIHFFFYIAILTFSQTSFWLSFIYLFCFCHKIKKKVIFTFSLKIQTFLPQSSKFFLAIFTLCLIILTFLLRIHSSVFFFCHRINKANCNVLISKFLILYITILTFFCNCRFTSCNSIFLWVYILKFRFFFCHTQ